MTARPDARINGNMGYIFQNERANTQQQKICCQSLHRICDKRGNRTKTDGRKAVEKLTTSEKMIREADAAERHNYRYLTSSPP
jgi:hypothetical protein